MSSIQNRERLLKKLAALPAAVRAEAKKAVHEGAEQVIAVQKRLAPVDDGDLRRSIQYRMGSFTAESSGILGRNKGTLVKIGDPELTATITAGDQIAWYARLVEFGTKPRYNVKDKGLFRGAYNPGTKAQPFFYPGWRSVRKRVKSRLSRSISKGVKKAVAN